jgi:hypothetical protein
MSTRGAVGILTEKAKTGLHPDGLRLAYNHSDSYPERLGMQVAAVADALRNTTVHHAYVGLVRDLVIVSETARPTLLELDALKKIAKRSVGHGTRLRLDGHTWYDVLREYQGDIPGYLSLGYWPWISAQSASHSLFMEWVYILDLDRGRLEVYKGFQDQPHNKGRFASLKPVLNRTDAALSGATDAWYPVALVAELPFGLAVEEMGALARSMHVFEM